MAVPASNCSQMLKTRLATAIVLLALFLSALFYLPTVCWAVLMLALVAVGGWEWAKLVSFPKTGRGIFVVALLLMGGVMLVAMMKIDGAARLTWTQIYSPAWLLAASVFWIVCVPLWLARGWRPLAPWLLALVGSVVLIPTWLALVGLRTESPLLLLGTIGCVWVADSAAYFAGRRFGRSRLAPIISPGKTWEGALGALLGVTLYGVLLSSAAQLSYWIIPGLWLVTLFSIEGDLFESWMKRQSGVKDSGRLFPGHGGVLDRIDAWTSALPVAAFVLLFLKGLH